MPKITIAGHFDLPEHLAPGEAITLTATLLIHSASQEQIDVSTIGNPQMLPGDIELETVALEAKAERV